MKLGEVFLAFLRLGTTSFGGPVAHLGYFRAELVERRRWLAESQFAELLAICQLLPGPASSQLGFGLGVLRAGALGGLAAFVGFTLPSAVLMVAFSIWLPEITGPTVTAVIQGLKLVALCVVAHGVLGMLKNLCPDATRRTIAALGAVVVLVAGSFAAQLVAVAGGAIAGLAFSRHEEGAAPEGLPVRFGARTGAVLLGAFALLLVLLPLASPESGPLSIAAPFYAAGALVFGGGHVVLPLLEEMVVAPGWISDERFLAGYGAAQAIPGPMFSFAAFLGADLVGDRGGLLADAIALVSIFLPGFLLLSGVLPVWRRVSARPSARRAIAGVNASVVGLLGAALYDPIFVSAVNAPIDLAIALVGFTLLAAWRVSPLVVVAWCIGASVASLALI
jgi:chromate transporter